MSTLLTLDQLSIAYGRQTVVQPLSFSLAPGQTLALVGESGCGKTSTAMAIAGLLPSRAHTTGRVLFKGVDLLSLNRKALRRYQGKEIGVIFQEPLSSLNPVLTVQTQLDELLRTHTALSRAERHRRIMESLQRVGLPRPEQLMRRFPHELSGGQRQRVMIALAVACAPQLLIADEPTTALDVTTQKQILELIAELKQDLNMAVLLISHDLAVVNEQAEQMIVMHNGRVQEQGPTRAVLQAPTHHYTKTLIRASLSIDADKHYQDTHHSLSKQANPHPGPDPLLQLQGISKAFGQGKQHHTAINNLSMTIQPGETVGLVGESGCGKSTLSRIIMQLLPADAGTLHYAGQPIDGPNSSRNQSLRRKIQMIFQDPYGSLNPRLTIGRLFERLQKLHFPQRSPRQRTQQAVSMLDAVRLPAHSLNRYPYEFSGGQRQRIAIARCLLLQPELLICDEPVSALDVSVQAQILDLFIELRQAFSLSYLFISHDLAVVRYIADRILIMHQGQIVETQRHDEQRWSAAQHPYTQRLLAATPRFSHSLAQGEIA